MNQAEEETINQSEGIEKEIESGIFRKLTYLDRVMVAVVTFRTGPMEKPQPYHHHLHEQITYVAKGRLNFFIGEQIHQLKAGDILGIPSNMNHTVQVLSDEVILVDAFNPIREDFLK